MSKKVGIIICQLQEMEKHADDIMELMDGETEEDLRGYVRGAYFTAKNFKQLIQELRLSINDYKDYGGETK